MNKICSGCGVKLQSLSSNEPGYINEEKLLTSNYCKRCFRLIHYGETKSDKELSIDNILDKVNNSNNYKIYIVDILNINNNTINIFNKIKGNKLLLISKIDLISKSINLSHIISNIKTIYKINNIKCISSSNNYGINNLLDYLYNNNIKEVSLLGPSNSGKSTLINKLMDIYNLDTTKLTTSNKRNTTLDFIKIKLDNKLTILDSPGFLIKDYGLISKYKNIIKPITFNMKSNETLLIDKFYIKFKNPTSITIYIYNKINIKKYYKEIKIDYEISVNKNTDLCINGLGFINIKKENTLYIYNLDKELLSTRLSIIGDNYGK